MIAYVDAPVLTDGVELVDTPGTGSVFTWDNQAAYDALETTDAAIFVLTADAPISASERDLLRRVATSTWPRNEPPGRLGTERSADPSACVGGVTMVTMTLA